MIAVLLIGIWGIVFFSALFGPRFGVHFWRSLATIPILSFLFTGLFITGHDAMHGSVAPCFPRLNRWIGRISVSLYALFSYSKLKTQHHDHHRFSTGPKDPDYHEGSFWSWYLQFFKHYFGWVQFFAICLVAQVPIHGFGVSPLNIYFFWVVPSLMSSLQLFYFGTYLPHRRPQEHGYEDQHHARNTSMPKWASLVSCFHFGGFHLVHHRFPWLAWWQLPKK